MANARKGYYNYDDDYYSYYYSHYYYCYYYYYFFIIFLILILAAEGLTSKASPEHLAWELTACAPERSDDSELPRKMEGHSRVPIVL